MTPVKPDHRLPSDADLEGEQLKEEYKSGRVRELMRFNFNHSFSLSCLITTCIINVVISSTEEATINSCRFVRSNYPRFARSLPPSDSVMLSLARPVPSPISLLLLLQAVQHQLLSQLPLKHPQFVHPCAKRAEFCHEHKGFVNRKMGR